jgi:mannose/cellobiose epimerase-like protein (N-acyl-D-glucosamine 2-epimerase family)
MRAATDVSRDGLRRFLVDEFLRLWSERAIDRERGGFHNGLDASLRPTRDEHKRLLTQTRLIYAFSHGALLGAPDWALDAARHGLAFVREKFRDPHHGGYYRSVALDGAPLDRGKDLYEHAFVLFALAYYARASGDHDALLEARAVLDLVQTHLAASEGFLDGASQDWRPLAGTRRQNPHMHLLEACLALAEVDGDARWLELARDLVALMQRRFLDTARGCLVEFFSDDWQPEPGTTGRILEPGHHFEWVWLLHAYARAAGDDAPLGAAKQLFGFAQRHGIDPSYGGAYDQIDLDGAVRVDSKRLWPQTEYAKALAARAETGSDPAALDALRGALTLLFERYGSRDHAGFGEHAERDGRLRAGFMPATSVYHVTFVLSEASRVLPA